MGRCRPSQDTWQQHFPMIDKDTSFSAHLDHTSGNTVEAIRPNEQTADKVKGTPSSATSLIFLKLSTLHLTLSGLCHIKLYLIQVHLSMSVLSTLEYGQRTPAVGMMHKHSLL